jgi:hypothetical protein
MKESTNDALKLIAQSVGQLNEIETSNDSQIILNEIRQSINLLEQAIDKLATSCAT